MKPMIWHPEPQDKKVNDYLEQVNHEPWLLFWAAGILLIFALTVLIIMGVF
jgi:hypothetical protein